jgi:bifunctional ADP-heptose synthase (sugar kinase/adenylyltransferase)
MLPFFRCFLFFEAASRENPPPLALARKLSDAHNCDVVITLGRHGMVCAERSGATWHLPAVPTEVRDVCGAGDTVFAALAVTMITGKSFRAACRTAMGAAGRQVGEVGVATVA